MKTVLCFGNEFVKEDSLAKILADTLSIDGFIFQKCDKVEEVQRFREKNPNETIIILDVIKDVKKPILITDLDQLKTTSSVTLHDFDLAFFLKLLDKTGELGDFKIIGIPMEGDKITIIDPIKKLIQ
jgi:Ni,Fe-hydrogenase maturation factor